MFGSGATSSTPLFGSSSTAPSRPLFSTPSTAAPLSTATAPLFAPAVSTQAGPLFGGQSTVAPSFGGGLFPSVATTSVSAAPAFNFSSMSRPLTTTPATGAQFSFNVQQQQQQQQMAMHNQLNFPQNAEILARSLTGPELFGDERDGVIAKLNQIEAFCGTGRGYVKAGLDPYEYTKQGPFCRFKAIGYNRKQTGKDSDGLVTLVCRRPATDVQTSEQRQMVVDQLFKVLGSKPPIHAHIESVKPLPDNSCEVVIFCTEQNEHTGAKKRVNGCELAQFLNQPPQKTQLQTLLSVDQVIARLALNDVALQSYLNVPPMGFDPLLWQQALRDNPNPTTLIPWPIRGFGELRERQKLQVQEGNLQQLYLKEILSRVSTLEVNLSGLEARNVQLRANQNRLSHRLLKALAVQFLQQRYGFAVDGVEERLQSRLEAFNVQLNAPAQLKGRLTELLSVIRCQPELLTTVRETTVTLRSEEKSVEKRHLEREMQRYLSRCQQGLETLVDLVDQDTRDLKSIVSALQTHSN